MVCDYKVRSSHHGVRFQLHLVVRLHRIHGDRPGCGLWLLRGARGIGPGHLLPHCTLAPVSGPVQLLNDLFSVMQM